MIATFLRRHSQRRPQRRPVFFRLNKHRRDLLDGVESGAGGKIEVGRAPIRKIGQFRRRQREFFCERHGLDADLLPDLAKSVLD